MSRDKKPERFKSEAEMTPAEMDEQLRTGKRPETDEYRKQRPDGPARDEMTVDDYADELKKGDRA